MNTSLDEPILSWLLDGDVSVQYRVRLELLQEDPAGLISLRRRIASEGWGKAILDAAGPGGGWGERYYQPKWISTHYTLIELLRLGIAPDTMESVQAVTDAINQFLADDGAFHCFGSPETTDDCVSGMFLETASWFGGDVSALQRLTDFLIERTMGDGGWNCRSNRSGATHSSVHTTISCLEGFREFRKRCPDYRPDDVRLTVDAAEEFLLEHHLAYSHHSGTVMHPDMLKLSWPCRWKFDILRGLEYFADVRRPHDKRMDRALTVLRTKRRKDGTWPMQNRHAGKVHIWMEHTGGPSRWNTFRALKILDRLT